MQASVVEYCAEIGKDPLLVQGAGGNVSWKDGDTLWVKASGTWLADAAVKDIFVPVDLPHLRNEIAAGNFSVAPKVIGESTLRPSIETLLHALMPQRVVVHVHAIDVLARLVRVDFDRHVAALLDSSLRWVKVPYLKPGAPLAEAIGKALKPAPDADVIFLQNHGVVIGGADIAEVDRKLRMLTDALKTVPRTASARAEPVNALEAGIEPSYVPVADEAVQQLAFDPILFDRLARDWALYPDHVVFLGPRAFACEDSSAFSSLSGTDAMPELVFVRAAGVFVKPGFSIAKQAQLRCYYDVLSRQTDDCLLASLNDRQIAELLDWDAERYRMHIAK